MRISYHVYAFLPFFGPYVYSLSRFFKEVPTFIVAGHETTSTAVAWSLYALTQDVRVQTKLREECLGLATENPTMEELNGLPYLDAVVRESLRVHPPAPLVQRVAEQDDVLPLRHPFTDDNGFVHNEIQSVNRHVSIYRGRFY